MPNRPLVSVVTPTLNQATFLEATLASVRAQTYPRIEHIVVDGGSTDATVELLRRAAAEGSIRFISETDSGMYDAVNKGLALANGEVVAYLNSDDAWLPWAVESVLQVLEARPEVDLVYGDGVKVEHKSGSQRLRLFPPFDRVSLANYESLMQPAVFWRRRLVGRLGGFDASMHYVADLDFWLRAAEAGANIVHVDEVLAVERLHGGRLSASQKDAMAAEDAAMRAHHAGPEGGPAARERAKQRDIEWQRRLLRRFVRASILRRFPVRLPGPWPHFLHDGRTRVRWRQVLEAAEPHQHALLKNATVSRAVADVLRAGQGDQPPARPKVKGLRRLARRTRRRATRVVVATAATARRVGAQLGRPLLPLLRIEPIATYRFQARKGRLAGQPSVGLFRLLADFVPWLRSRNRSTLNGDRPWMTFDAVRALDRQVQPGARIFEYGSGGSTVYFGRRASELVSVEHDEAWYDQVKRASAGLPTVEVVLQKPRPANGSDDMAYRSSSPEFEGQTFADYVRVVDRFPDHHFDALIVDGRARAASFFRAEPKVRIGGVVVLDDSERDHYVEILAAARRAGWTERGRFGPKPVTPWFARTTVWTKTRDLPGPTPT